MAAGAVSTDDKENVRQGRDEAPLAAKTGGGATASFVAGGPHECPPGARSAPRDSADLGDSADPGDSGRCPSGRAERCAAGGLGAGLLNLTSLSDLDASVAGADGNAAADQTAATLNFVDTSIEIAEIDDRLNKLQSFLRAAKSGRATSAEFPRP
jgi:hypothetical protein